MWMQVDGQSNSSLSQSDFLATGKANQLWLIYKEKEFTQGFLHNPRNYQI